MSFLSKLGSFVSKMWDQVKSALAAMIAKMGVFAPLLILAVFVFAPYLSIFAAGGMLASIGSVLTALGVYGSLALGLGLAWLVAPEGTAELIAVVGEVAGEIITAAVDVAATGFGALWNSLGSFKVPILLGAGYVGYNILFGGNDNEDDSVVVSSNSTNQY